MLVCGWDGVDPFIFLKLGTCLADGLLLKIFSLHDLYSPKSSNTQSGGTHLRKLHVTLRGSQPKQNNFIRYSTSIWSVPNLFLLPLWRWTAWLGHCPLIKITTCITLYLLAGFLSFHDSVASFVIPCWNFYKVPKVTLPITRQTSGLRVRRILVKLDKAPQPASVLRLVTSNGPWKTAMETSRKVEKKRGGWKTRIWLSGWWLLISQPIWKICSSNWKIFLKMGGEKWKKNRWNPSFAGFPKCSAFKFEESIANFHGQEDQKISCSAFRSGLRTERLLQRNLWWKSPLTRKKRRQKTIQPGISWPFGHGSFILKATFPGMNECHLKRDHSKIHHSSGGMLVFRGVLPFSFEWRGETHHRLWQDKRWICLEYPYRKALLITNLLDLFYCVSCFNPPKFLKSQTILGVQEKNYVANLDHFPYLLSLFILQ